MFLHTPEKLIRISGVVVILSGYAIIQQIGIRCGLCLPEENIHCPLCISDAAITTFKFAIIPIVYLNYYPDLFQK
jgi:hypothetical protein